MIKTEEYNDNGSLKTVYVTAPPGTGKTSAFFGGDILDSNGEPYHKVYVSPYVTLRDQNADRGVDCMTVDALVNALEQDSFLYEDTVFFFDEAHAIYESASYRPVMSAFVSLFQSLNTYNKVIFASGTMDLKVMRQMFGDGIVVDRQWSDKVLNVTPCKSLQVVASQITMLPITRAIIFLNDKSYLEGLANIITDEYLVISADTNKTPEVVDYIKRNGETDHKVVCMTSCGIAGINIDTDISHMICIGEQHPSSIVQFFARDRKQKAECHYYPIKNNSLVRDDLEQKVITLCDYIRSVGGFFGASVEDFCTYIDLTDMNDTNRYLTFGGGFCAVDWPMVYGLRYRNQTVDANDSMDALRGALAPYGYSIIEQQPTQSQTRVARKKKKLDYVEECKRAIGSYVGLSAPVTMIDWHALYVALSGRHSKHGELAWRLPAGRMLATELTEYAKTNDTTIQKLGKYRVMKRISVRVSGKVVTHYDIIDAYVTGGDKTGDLPINFMRK
jgi:hypothetical protein